MLSQVHGRNTKKNIYTIENEHVTKWDRDRVVIFISIEYQDTKLETLLQHNNSFKYEGMSQKCVKYFWKCCHSVMFGSNCSQAMIYSE